MPADFNFVQGDTHVVATDALTYSDGTAVDLDGATVTFVMRSLTSSTPLTLTGSTTVTNAASGEVQFSPSGDDTSTPGEYMANWYVVFPDASDMTFPTEGYLWVRIQENLSTAGGQQLVSLPQVKDYMASFGLNSDRAHDAKLIGFIQAVTPLIENRIGPVLVRTFDEWHDGGQYWIQLRRRPSSAIGCTPVLNLVGVEEYRGPTKYTLAIVADPAQATTYSVMLDLHMGTVYRRTTGGGVIPFSAGPWGGGMPQGVHVVYQAGQATVPANVAEAAMEVVRANYETTQTVGSGSMTVTDALEGRMGGLPLGSYLPPRALELLAPMRRRPAIA